MMLSKWQVLGYDWPWEWVSEVECQRRSLERRSHGKRNPHGKGIISEEADIPENDWHHRGHSDLEAREGVQGPSSQGL